METMQPVDASRDRAHYVADPAYLGQPKRDGHRVVVFATPDAVHYQARSGKRMASPGPAFNRAIRAVAAEVGPFILDGEKLYLDKTGGEHRTASQAGEGAVCCLSIFKALHAERDLRGDGELVRINAAEPLVSAIAAQLAGLPRAMVEMVPTARTEAEKRALCDRQLAEGREGEVWIRADTAYRSGKVGEAMVRTKYVTETDCAVVGLTATTVPGRPFGALVVAEILPDGTTRPVGHVGTGFTDAEADEIAALHNADPGCVCISVRHQGRTEGGMLWHARFLEIIRLMQEGKP